MVLTPAVQFIPRTGRWKFAIPLSPAIKVQGVWRVLLFQAPASRSSIPLFPTTAHRNAASALGQPAMVPET
jgi:hypothetical protein